MPVCFIGLGSNLGDRRAALTDAIEGLERKGAITAPERSSVYESPALLPEGAPQEWNIPYLNCVVMATTKLTPQDLLAAMQAQEAAQGKDKIGHWAPRCIDIDLLDYDSEVVATEALALPHPHLHRRDFVLLPWRDVAPHWCHPLLGLTIEDMADMLPEITAKRYLGL